MGWPAQRLQIFGVHFHVGVRHGERVLAISNGLAGYIPHLLALSASSPYWEKRDTGLASSRSKVFEALPTAGPARVPQGLGRVRALHDHADLRRRAVDHPRGVVGHPAPPGFRHHRVADVRRAPHPAGGDRPRRPEPVPRHVDGPAGRGGEDLHPPSDWVLRQNKWRAARYGIDAELIVDEEGTTRPLPDAVRELVDAVRPVGAQLGCADELEGVLTILDEGPELPAPAAAGRVRRRPPGRGGPVGGRHGRSPVTAATDDALDAFLAAHGEELIAFRRRLHAHPELSWVEHETTAAVRARLDVAGIAHHGPGHRHRPAGRPRRRRRAHGPAPGRHRRAAPG